jgi:hypothetical protein
VKVDQVASFLSRKLSGNYQGEAGGSFSTRIEGTCIKHHMGRAAAIKMYDELGRVLRVETPANDVSFFKHHRKVEHRDCTSSFKLADLPKSIFSLPVLIELMGASNRRSEWSRVSTLHCPNVWPKGIGPQMDADGAQIALVISR